MANSYRLGMSEFTTWPSFDERPIRRTASEVALEASRGVFRRLTLARRARVTAWLSSVALAACNNSAALVSLGAGP